MTTMMAAMNNVGYARVATAIRLHGPAAVGTIAKGAGVAAVSYESVDAMLATFDDPQTILDRNARNIRIAELQEQGYTFEVPGQAAGEDFIMAADDPTNIIIRDPEGNVISSDEKDALLDGDTLPDEFGGDGDLPIAPTTASELTTPESLGTSAVFGTADQYQPLDQSGLDLAELFAQSDLKTDEQLQAEEDAEYAKNPFIGVDRDYFRGGDAEAREKGGDLYYGSTRPLSQDEKDRIDRAYYGPIYRQSDVGDEIARWTAIDVLDFQERAFEAGLINTESAIDGVYFQAGTLDQHTIRALNAAMSQANINGDRQTYDDALDGMIEAREKFKEMFGDKDIPPTWTPSRGYEAPDYATISQGVKGLFARSLGRDPNGWEMDLLADQFRGDSRAGYDQDMSMEKAAFEARGRAQETGEVEIPPASTDIDPIARMAENFDDQFSDELDAKDRWADVQSKSANLFGSFDKLSRA
jgi:hypothetical protein